MSDRENLEWQTFDKFVVTNELKIWCIKLNKDNWIQNKCSYPYFSKNIKCKQIICIAAREKLENCTIWLQNQLLWVKDVNVAYLQKIDQHSSNIEFAFE